MSKTVVRDASLLTRCAGAVPELYRGCVGSVSDFRRIWRGILTLALAKIRFSGRATQSRGNLTYAEQRRATINEFDSHPKRRSRVET